MVQWQDCNLDGPKTMSALTTMINQHRTLADIAKAGMLSMVLGADNSPASTTNVDEFNEAERLAAKARGASVKAHAEIGPSWHTAAAVAHGKASDAYALALGTGAESAAHRKMAEAHEAMAALSKSKGK